jgi:hypothetical protein
MTTPAQYSYIGTAVRCSSLNAYYYRVGDEERFVTKIYNGTLNNICLTGVQDNSTNDVLELHVVGNTLTCYRNGEVDTSLGAAIAPATGNAGIYVDISILSGSPGIYASSYFDDQSTIGDNFIGWEI